MKIYEIYIDGSDHSGLIKSDMILIKEKGEYLGKTENYYNQSASYVNSLLEEGVFNKPTLMQIKGCSIYRYPKLSLPRQKVDHLKQSANISVTRNKETADYHIVSAKYIDSFFESSWASFLSNEDCKSLFSKVQNCFTNDAYIKMSQTFIHSFIHWDPIC